MSWLVFAVYVVGFVAFTQIGRRSLPHGYDPGGLFMAALLWPGAVVLFACGFAYFALCDLLRLDGRPT